MWHQICQTVYLRLCRIGNDCGGVGDAEACFILLKKIKFTGYSTYFFAGSLCHVTGVCGLRFSMIFVGVFKCRAGREGGGGCCWFLSGIFDRRNLCLGDVAIKKKLWSFSKADFNKGNRDSWQHEGGFCYYGELFTKKNLWSDYRSHLQILW